MTKRVLTSLLVAVLCVCCAHAEERYSSYECHSYDTARPDDLATRSCVLRDVSIDMERGQPVLVYHAPAGSQDTPLLAADRAAGRGRIAELAPRHYASVRVVHEPIAAEALAHQEDVTAALVASQGSGFAQTLLDTLFGLHWLLTTTGDVNATTGAVRDPSSVVVVEVGRANEHVEAVVYGALSSMPPVPLVWQRGKHFARVAVGPAAHHLLAQAQGRRSTATAEQLAAFRAFFHAAAHVDAASFDAKQVLLGHRVGSGGSVVTNTGALLAPAAPVAPLPAGFFASSSENVVKSDTIDTLGLLALLLASLRSSSFMFVISSIDVGT